MSFKKDDYDYDYDYDYAVALCRFICETPYWQ